MDKIEKVSRAADGCDPDAMGYAVTEKTKAELGKNYPLWKVRLEQAKAAIVACLETSGESSEV